MRNCYLYNYICYRLIIIVVKIYYLWINVEKQLKPYNKVKLV